MTFADIEQVLGAQNVKSVRDAVQAVYVAAQSSVDPMGARALEDLLIMMVVAVTVTPNQRVTSQARISDCTRRLQEVAAETLALCAKDQNPLN